MTTTTATTSTTTRPQWYDDKLVAYAGRIARLSRVFGGKQHEEVAQDIYLDAISRWDKCKRQAEAVQRV